MDLLGDPPKLDLFDPAWPIWTFRAPCAPARVGASVTIASSIIGEGTGLDGDVCRSVVSTRCAVGRHARIKDSILLPDAKIGKNCSLDRVIVDSHCAIPDNTVLGGELFGPLACHRYHARQSQGVRKGRRNPRSGAAQDRMRCRRVEAPHARPPLARPRAEPEWRTTR